MDDLPKRIGEAIRDELRRLCWTQADLAQVIGRPTAAVNELIQGKRALSFEMAAALGAAFGKNPSYWLDLDSHFRLSKVLSDPEIPRRARIFQFAPVMDMQRRGWLSQSADLDRLEAELCAYFEIPSLDAKPNIRAAARKTGSEVAFTNEQLTWCFHAKRLAQTLDVGKFRSEDLNACLEAVRGLTVSPPKTRYVPKLLADVGIRLVVVEPLPRSRIDGATMWLGPDAPVVALSLRNDRIDSIYHTLFHELSHVGHGDAFSVDQDCGADTEASSSELPEIEKRADTEAAHRLVNAKAMEKFIAEVRPFFSKERITALAKRQQLHPGIVLGQLQKRGLVGWQAHRDLLVKVRDILVPNALTDGWATSAR